jgi:hypothetical protein
MDGVIMAQLHRAWIGTVGLTTAIVGLSVAPAHGQSTHERTSGRPWRASTSVAVTTGYDDNVFLLADSKVDDLTSPSASARTSGRYADMQSGGDLVTTFRASAGLRGSGIAGRTLQVAPEVAYDAYLRNAERRNFTLALDVDQSLPHDGELRVRGRLTPSYFAKNYLADALDSNGDGSIGASERIYAPGTYAESDVSFDYRFRVAKSTKSHPFGAAVRVGAGWYNRGYDAPFGARDLNGPTFELGLPLDLTRRLAVQARYERLQLSATPTRSVLLIDESQFNRDFNGNGRTTDQNARAFEMVDRSRTENTADIEARYEVTPRVDLRLDYEHRSRTYGSSAPYDIANNGRRDSRNQFGLELGWHVTHGVDVMAAGRLSAQTLNRENDPGAVGDVDDYRKHEVRLGLVRRF